MHCNKIACASAQEKNEMKIMMPQVRELRRKSYIMTLVCMANM